MYMCVVFHNSASRIERIFIIKWKHLWHNIQPETYISHSTVVLCIPYSGTFSRGNIFIDFVVTTKPPIFFTHEQGMCMRD